MTKLQAFTALRDKVKAGADLTYRDFSVLNFDGTVHGEVIGLGSYGGSLDAAKALHEAVLPGWALERLTMWPGGECTAHLWGTHDIDGERWHNFQDGRSDATSETPARAWLLAILEALIAQEGQG